MYSKAMTSGAPWRHIVRFALPILAGALLQQMYHTTDTIIVGNLLGQDALAAVGTTNTLTFFMLSAALGFSQGNGVLVSQFYGAGNHRQVQRSAATGIWFLGVAGVLLSLAGMIFAKAAYTHLVAVPEKILKDTVLYFQIYSAGLFFQFGYNILSSILRAVSDSAATLYFLLIASLLNIALDLLFVAVFHWGVAGAAAATCISQLIAMVAAWCYMVKKYPVFRFKKSEFVFDAALAAETFRVGLPITLQMMFVSMGLTLIQRAVNSFGEVMTAAFTVGQRIEMYMHLPGNSFMATLATYTGQNIGAAKPERGKRGAWQGVLVSIGITAILSLAVGLFAQRIIGAFGLGSVAAGYCREYLKAVVLTNLILAAYVPLFGFFQGSKHSLVPAIVALSALGLRVAVTFLLKDGAFFGHSIIWWNGLFGFSLGCIITWSCFMLLKQKICQEIITSLPAAEKSLS